MVTLTPDGPLVVIMKYYMELENSCLYITRAARLLDKAYNSLKSRPQNFLINCVGMSVFCHLKLVLTATNETHTPKGF